MSDARFERTRIAVHEAVCTVLVEDGLAGLTHERVAAHAGVARSTVYRNWPDMAGLACEVFDELAHRHEIEMTGDVPSQLKRYLADYAERLNNEVYTAVLLAVIEAANRDEAFADVHRVMFHQTRSRAGEIVRRGQREGLFDAELDVADCVEDLVAPFLYRRLVRQDVITRSQVNTLHATLLARWASSDQDSSER